MPFFVVLPCWCSLERDSILSGFFLLRFKECRMLIRRGSVLVRPLQSLVIVSLDGDDITGTITRCPSHCDIFNDVDCGLLLGRTSVRLELWLSLEIVIQLSGFTAANLVSSRMTSTLTCSWHSVDQLITDHLVSIFVSVFFSNQFEYN